MKKTIMIFLTISALLLTGCARKVTPSPVIETTHSPDISTTNPTQTPAIVTDSSALKDGMYTAEVSEAYAQSGGHGWKEYLKITVSDARITAVEYDALKDGKKKSEATAEEYPMDPPPSEWIPQINDAIRMAEIPAAMDTVTGATMSSAAARQLYAAVLNAAKEGNTEVVVIEIS